MLSEGWTVGDIPVVEIEAENEKEAKKLLLLISSRYGHVTEEGFYEFVSMNELDWEELKLEIDLPEITDEFWEGYAKDKGNSVLEESDFYTLNFKFQKDQAAYVQEKLHDNREIHNEELDEHWRERCLIRLLKQTD